MKYDLSKTQREENFDKQVNLIPNELKALQQWVVWRFEERGGKKTKVPYCAKDPKKKANSNDSSTWESFDKAQEVVQKGQAEGIGFVFSSDDPFVGIDLDHCTKEDGALEPWAQEIVEKLNSYTEWSPSGQGLHIFVKGKLSLGRRRKGSIEMYDSKRFFTMTGNHVEGTPPIVEEREAELKRLYGQVFGSKSGSEKQKNRSGEFKGSGLSDEEILDEAKVAKNGEAFSKLFFGNYIDDYPSQSEADLALCSYMAFWTGPNSEQIDRLFRQSKLYRKKWDERRGEKTYGAITIEKAIEEMPEFYGQTNDSLSDLANHGHPHGNPSDPPNIADGFLTHCGYRTPDGLRLRWYRQEWLRFNGKAFVSLPNHDLNAEVMAFIQKGPSRRKATQMLLKNVVVNLQSMCFMPSDVSLPARWNGTEWESGNAYLVVANGIVDLQTLIKGRANASLTTHTLNLVSKVELPFGFDPNAQCPKWKTFLEEVLPNPESRQLLRELFGYCLTYDTSLQKFFLFEGSGANGKSIVLRVLTALLGNANISGLPLEIFGAPHGLETTLGKLVNITSDLGDVDRVAEGLLKQFTGDDLMHFNPKYRDSFTAKPTAKLIIATNVRPPFRDRSQGLWRRLILLLFPVTIPEDCQNPDLTKELEEELPGILNWAISGGRSLRKRGRFQEPMESQKARKDFQRESNPARTFLEEACVYDAEEAENVTWLYDQYSLYCKCHGYRPLNANHFGKEVGKVYPKVKRVRCSKGGLLDEEGKKSRFYVYEGINYVEEKPALVSQQS